MKSFILEIRYDASHSPRQILKQGIFYRRWTQMDADILGLWVRDWLNSWVSHRTICVYLRSSVAKNPFCLYHAAIARWNPTMASSNFHAVVGRIRVVS